MANGAGTAGNILTTAAPLLNAVPVVGSVLSGAAGLVALPPLTATTRDNEYQRDRSHIREWPESCVSI